MKAITGLHFFDRLLAASAARPLDLSRMNRLYAVPAMISTRSFSWTHSVLFEVVLTPVDALQRFQWLRQARPEASVGVCLGMVF
jgi:hypothetical protein